MNTLNFKNYKITLDEQPGKFIARCVRETPRAKFGVKTIFAYYFKTDAERDNYIVKWQQDILKREEEKQQESAIKRTFDNPFKVGDLLYNSYGYDQTNIDFYQVVGIGSRSVKIQRIKGEKVEGSDGFMCCDVKPIPNSFFGNVETKILQSYVCKTNTAKMNQVVVYIPCKLGSISIYDGGDKGVYRSWYA